MQACVETASRTTTGAVNFPLKVCECVSGAPQRCRAVTRARAPLPPYMHAAMRNTCFCERAAVLACDPRRFASAKAASCTHPPSSTQPSSRTSSPSCTGLPCAPLLRR
ncbi:hypothetical protein EON67_09775 [archaeon]|nr:MAG: hypothetical protein EON67_09775 [archaeon]